MEVMMRLWKGPRERWDETYQGLEVHELRRVGVARTFHKN